MKRLAVITTSLLLTLTAAGGAISAYADEAEKAETHYPENFNKTLVFTDLKDYDIDGNTYYFLDGETYYRYEKSKDGKSGELEEFEPEEEFSFAPSKTTVTISNDSYIFRLTGTVLEVAAFESKEFKTFEGEYSKLKELGGCAYAVKENVLYRFESAEEPSAVQPVYADYSETEKIAVGQAAENLKNYSGLTFVKVKAGSFMTAIDLTSLEGEYFRLDFSKQKAIDKANNVDVKNKVYPASDATYKVDKDTPALLLCYTGNAAIVALGDTADGTAYILFNDASTVNVLNESEVGCRKEAEFANATIIGNRIYSSPFTVTGTTLKPNAAGTNVTVNCKIVCEGEFQGLLNSVYYEVVYKNEEGEDVTGYVAAGFLTEYIIEDNKDPATFPDPEHNESTRVTTVLLILAVVVLVLVAVGYIVYTATSGRKKKDKKETPEEIK